MTQTLSVRFSLLVNDISLVSSLSILSSSSLYSIASNCPPEPNREMLDAERF